MTRRNQIPQECKNDAVPPWLRAKITEFANAAREYAFTGAMDTARADEVEMAYHVAWMNLEATIATAIKRAAQ